MITAADARELAKNSDAEVERHLENICNYIEAQATIGKRWLYLTNTPPYDAVFQVKEPLAYRNVEFTPLQKRLQECLTNLGFCMRIESEKYDHNQMPGMGMSGELEGEDIRTRYYITVSW